ncbi:hypothetical protein [Cellulosimicrobium arenosum]|uniref:Cell division protein FtsL n=1 Tax=Cellulosimicrobium arenosum TaxID=2708133 RepID=A0A927GAR8_9MICO|nr:hypothetical protein [Cellulosimicrobium arenosum]MBD8079200.1 hypothetical protein [Cellulosimicrobium arenosum]
MSASTSAATSRPPARSARPATRPTVSGRPALTALPGGAVDRGTRSRLELVRAPLQARSRVPFLVVCMSVLGTALLLALVLNTSMARGSYEMSDLRREMGRVAEDTQSLQSAVREAEAALPDRARALGMVEAEDPAMVRLSDGAVVGAGGKDEDRP